MEPLLTGTQGRLELDKNWTDMLMLVLRRSESSKELLLALSGSRYSRPSLVTDS